MNELNPTGELPTGHEFHPPFHAKFPPSSLLGLLAGLFLAAGIAFASLVVARAWTRIAETQGVTVTGSARKNVRSDLVVWHDNFSTSAATLGEARQAWQTALAKVNAFLRARGLTTIAAQPVQISELTAKQQNDDDHSTLLARVGFRSTQPLIINSTDVENVPRLASGTGELLPQDIALVPERFDFIYT